ncbi:beta-ig-h3 fasciclin [Colletotrichum truncatum]|uniref:Beta-ig-h3 fasciclin n=1 Tax=Colletotrichum truncatum TaxID=5467 RepID=A0ACC3YWE0_COLTU|nr:beta-ig-h3 fasciclin [Colletotrichum truncatum]KAF6787364.1 beta-ig-h3 fasciclin [Colletotrichum truncatum]
MRIRRSSCALWASSLSLVFGVSAVAAQKLEEVLEKQANLTTFRRLVKDHGDIFSKLPTSGVTQILAPSDQAYLKGQGWDANKDEISVALLYGIINGKISFDALFPGNSSIEDTLLTDSRYSNVTGGQSVLVTKSPNNEVVVTSGVAQRTTAIRTDITFDGGLIQIIDSLMVTPARLEKTVRDAYQDLTSFLGALYTTDLVSEFAETRNVTIFAPRNAAFQQVAGALSGLSKDDLRRVLRYHIVPSTVVGKAALANGTKLATGIDKKSLEVTLFNNDIFIDSARIIQTDILIANGVVQVLDAVLNVNSNNTSPNVTAVTQAPVFTLTGNTETGTAAPTPFASALPCTTDCPVTGGGGGGGNGSGKSGTGTATGGVRPSSSTGGVAPARCTGGITGAAMGLGLAVGVLGMEAIGVVV